MRDEILGTGAFEDGSTRRRFLQASAEDIVAKCVGSVRDNANVRFRARFAIYAQTVLELQRRFVEDMRGLTLQEVGRSRRPRRVALPWLHLHEVVSPPLPEDFSEQCIDGRLLDLRGLLVEALEREVGKACHKLARRCVASTARTLVAGALVSDRQRASPRAGQVLAFARLDPG